MLGILFSRINVMVRLTGASEQRRVKNNDDEKRENYPYTRLGCRERKSGHATGFGCCAHLRASMRCPSLSPGIGSDSERAMSFGEDGKRGRAFSLHRAELPWTGMAGGRLSFPRIAHFFANAPVEDFSLPVQSALGG